LGFWSITDFGSCSHSERNCRVRSLVPHLGLGRFGYALWICYKGCFRTAAHLLGVTDIANSPHMKGTARISMRSGPFSRSRQWVFAAHMPTRCCSVSRFS